MQRLLHAKLFYATQIGSNSGLIVMIRSFFNITSVICDLSYFISLSIKSLPNITDFAEFQSVFSYNNIHTASSTNYTTGGGLINPLISAISFLLIFYNASSASLSAGNALFSSV